MGGDSKAMQQLKVSLPGGTVHGILVDSGGSGGGDGSGGSGGLLELTLVNEVGCVTHFWRATAIQP